MPESGGYGILKGRCPRCKKGHLYKGLLAVAERCEACELSFAGHEQGDGPAFFGITIVGTLVAIFATIVEVKYEPPFWLHAVLWVPFIFVGSILVLRWAKAAIIALQFERRPEDFS